MTIKLVKVMNFVFLLTIATLALFLVSALCGVLAGPVLIIIGIMLLVLALINYAIYHLIGQSDTVEGDFIRYKQYLPAKCDYDEFKQHVEKITQNKEMTQELKEKLYLALLESRNGSIRRVLAASVITLMEISEKINVEESEKYVKH